MGYQHFSYREKNLKDTVSSCVELCRVVSSCVELCRVV